MWFIIRVQCLETLDWIRSEGHTGVVRRVALWAVTAEAQRAHAFFAPLHNNAIVLTSGCRQLQVNHTRVVTASDDKTVKVRERVCVGLTGAGVGPAHWRAAADAALPHRRRDVRGL